MNPTDTQARRAVVASFAIIWLSASGLLYPLALQLIDLGKLAVASWALVSILDLLRRHA